jgi:hypothetical protein
MIKWEQLKHDESGKIYRAKVPGGWLILFGRSMEGMITFYPDPEHAWDGSSLP